MGYFFSNDEEPIVTVMHLHWSQSIRSVTPTPSNWVATLATTYLDWADPDTGQIWHEQTAFTMTRILQDEITERHRYRGIIFRPMA